MVLLILLTALGGYLRYVKTDWNKDILYSKTEYRLAGDEYGYDKSVRVLLEKGYYGFTPFSTPEGPNAFTTPGYTLFLAGIYTVFGYGEDPPLVAIQAIQNLLSLCTGFIFFWIAWRLFNNRFISCLIFFFCMIHPGFIYLSSYLFTETLYLFLLSAFALVMILHFQKGGGHEFLMGLLFGCTLLVRPVLFPFFLLLLGFMLLQKRKKKLSWRPILLLAGGLLLIMGPWWIRNLVTMGKMVILAEQAGNPLLWGSFPYNDNADVDPAIPPDELGKLAWQRIFQGFTQEFWLYLEWYTIGKAEYLINTVYTGFLHVTSAAEDLFYKNLAMAGGAGLVVSLLWNRKKKEFLWVLLLGLTGFVLYLPFAPTTRYFYAIVPFTFLGIACFVQLLVYIARGLVKKKIRKQQAGTGM
ncbi:putative membrane protein [Paenibacillus larvae subsp. larvae]|uniref:Putative membrane protein n=2 Tax=Paenibacillus larvae TaxID=1464 RepID=A0A2L1UBM8_9BACL|nr:putative membrane protein [Paenibacillus larvae subsp. larvae]AVF30336.1 putative membrane protein [Paenibacillus larvae subsp. larvae]